MRPEFPGLWKVVESRRLLWLVGLTFALIVTFQYIELPNTLSSLFSSTKFPSSRNSTSLTRDSQHQSRSSNLSPAMPPSFPQKNATTLVDDSGGGDGDEEVEVDKIFDTSGNATAPANATAPVATAKPPAALPLVKVNATAPTVSHSQVKENATEPAATANPPAALPLVNENATAPVASANPPAALPTLNRSPVKENATTSQVEEDKKSTKTDAGSVSPVVRFVPDVKENSKMPDSGVMSISEMSKQLRRNRISHNRLAKVHQRS